METDSEPQRQQVNQIANKLTNKQGKVMKKLLGLVGLIASVAIGSLAIGTPAVKAEQKIYEGQCLATNTIKGKVYMVSKDCTHAVIVQRTDRYAEFRFSDKKGNGPIFIVDRQPLDTNDTIKYKVVSYHYLQDSEFELVSNTPQGYCETDFRGKATVSCTLKEQEGSFSIVVDSLNLDTSLQTASWMMYYTEHDLDDDNSDPKFDASEALPVSGYAQKKTRN